MLYTPLSYDDILPEQKAYEQYEMVSYRNRLCYVSKMENGQKQLIQLLSTNPNDYLSDDFIPGTIISP